MRVCFAIDSYPNCIKQDGKIPFQIQDFVFLSGQRRKLNGRQAHISRSEKHAQDRQTDAKHDFDVWSENNHPTCKTSTLSVCRSVERNVFF